MKHRERSLTCYLVLLGLAGFNQACSDKRNAGPPTSPAAAHAAVVHLIQQLAGPGTGYAPLKWGKTTLLHPPDAGEASIQEAVGLWLADQRHSDSFMDSLPNLQGLAQEANSAPWRRALSSASAAGKRARQRSYTLTHFIDSVRRSAGPRPADTTTVIGQRGWHTFRLTNRHGRLHRDSVEYIVLASGKAVLCIPQPLLAKRPWEPNTQDPF